MVEWAKEQGAKLVDLVEATETRMPVQEIRSATYTASGNTKPWDRCKCALWNFLDVLERFSKHQPRNWIILFSTTYDYPPFLEQLRNVIKTIMDEPLETYVEVLKLRGHAWNESTAQTAKPLRIVLANNAAATSHANSDINCLLDLCLEYIRSYDNRLVRQPSTWSTTVQRNSRVGRVIDGIAFLMGKGLQHAAVVYSPHRG